MKCFYYFEMHLFKYRLINESVRLNGCQSILKRFSSKKGSKSQGKYACSIALKHFDDFYKAVFAEKWPSVRLGLLSKQKYFALINNFGEVERTENLFKNQGAFDLKSFLEVQKDLNIQWEDDSANRKNKTDLSGIVSQQLDLEEERESHLHPEGLDFKRNVDSYEDAEEEEEYAYHPDDARTSLKSDISRSQYDTSRLILPNSNEGDGKLQEFIPATQLRGANSYVAESDYYKYYKMKSKECYNIEEGVELKLPENLKVYTFDRGDISEFPEPTPNIINVHDFLKIDGSDLLAALALGVEQNDTVLDLCSTTPSIALCLFQTLRTRFLLCTNTDGTTESLFEKHVINLSSLLGDVLYFTPDSVDEIENTNLFDKILVDVLSTNDRVSLFEEENNIFHTKHIKKRLNLPQYQCDCLKRGLTLVRPGGTVLYTTSTLSPIQNESVVSEAVQALWKEQGLEFTIKDLTPALRHFSTIFNFGNYLNLKFGTLVVPFTPLNFGPRYICKIVKKEQEQAEEAAKPSQIINQTLF